MRQKGSKVAGERSVQLEIIFEKKKESEASKELENNSSKCKLDLPV